MGGTEREEDEKREEGKGRRNGEEKVINDERFCRGRFSPGMFACSGRRTGYFFFLEESPLLDFSRLLRRERLKRRDISKLHRREEERGFRR